MRCGRFDTIRGTVLVRPPAITTPVEAPPCGMRHRHASMRTATLAPTEYAAVEAREVSETKRVEVVMVMGGRAC